MLRAIRLGASAIVVLALAFVGWLVLRPGGTQATVAAWLKHDCGDVTVTNVAAPLAQSFPSAERKFTEAAKEVKAVTCEVLGGSIFYYRFASEQARLRAARADAAFYRSATTCAKGSEALYDNLIVGHALTASYCQRLHFTTEHALPRGQR